LSPATVVEVHGVLRNALADAERMDLVSRNVAKSVRPATIRRTERRALTPEEARNLLRVVVGDRLEAVFVLALSTGLRRGELLGLRWADVDLDGGALFVRRALQRVDGALRFVAPKAHRSARPVPLPAVAAEATRAHRSRQARAREASKAIDRLLGGS
jgi:integrase